MDEITLQQRIYVVQTYYENQRSIKNTYRKIRDFFGVSKRPHENSIRNLIKKFEETGSVENIKPPGRPRNVRTSENIAIVSESVVSEPTMSIPRRSQELDISSTSLWRILHLDLHLHPYKIQLTQELKPIDHFQRRRFVNWMLEQRAVDAGFSKKIITSDEAHFQLNGQVNKQNCRIWGEENPRIIQEQPLHAEKVTVWCGLWSQGIIGPYFFENDVGKAVTVNGERYNRMINEFLWPKLEEIDTSDLYFQQDGATCHTTRENIALLRRKFNGRLISRNGDINWPPRSCDLTPLDFFLWGYLKSRVYRNNPQTIQDLKTNIRDEIRGIEEPMLQKVMENYDLRITTCNKSRGGHLSDIVFHV